ncbi:MAG: hypothetical protein Q8N53_21340 [Longimicrobiales bacterium]|nr:hypothetical protein [Longimicrobiales bacterium]
MSHVSRSLFEALERWEQKALITPELAERLRQEAVDASEAGTARLSQYVVAATAAIVTLIAAGVFLDWAWPLMDAASRTGLLAAAGLGVSLWGARLETLRRWVPAALLMQVAGLGLLTVAFVYSKNAWTDGTAGGIAVGVAALAVPALLAPRTLRLNVVMPAVHLCFGLGFVAIFLDRATPLSGDTIIWLVDGVFLAVAATTVVLLRKDPDGQRHPWALDAFVAAAYAAAVLVLITATGPLDLEAEALYPLDAWLFLLVALTLWGIHRSPVGLRRDWFEDQLALCVLFWVPLGFGTAMEALNGPSELALVLVGGVAVLGFAYALRYRGRRILAASALAFIAAVWFWAADRAGALGAVAGLAFAATLLFWLSGRVGSWASKGEG